MRLLTRRSFLKQLGLGILLGGLAFIRSSSSAPIHVLGASYYVWYRSDLSNWRDGHIHTPLLGEYRSDDPRVMRTHLEWAEEYGVDVFFVSWVGHDGNPDVRYFDLNLQRLLEHRALFETDRRVALLYESADRFHRESDGTISFDRPENVERLLSDFEYLTKYYFEHPQFLRLNGRPVVYLYETLAFRGDVIGAFQALRQHIRVHRKLELFLISSDAHPLADPSDPALARRAGLFDGVSQWAAGYMTSGNYPKPYVEYLQTGYERWARFAGREGLEFVPSVIPGFDQRRVRWGDPTSVPLERSPKRFRKRLEVIRPWLSRHRLLRIDTWNDFFENTQIEPTRSEGFAYLEEVRRFKRCLQEF